MDANGRLMDAGTLPGVPGEMIATGVAGPEMQPGLYTGDDRQIAVNVMQADSTLGPAVWPANVPVEGLAVVRETLLKGWLLSIAIVLLLIDVIASLAIGGRLRGPRADAVAAVCLAAMVMAAPADAQEDDFAITATSEVVLAHVLTGDDALDAVANAAACKPLRARLIFPRWSRCPKITS